MSALDNRSVLILHNEYVHFGGEDVVVAAEAELLRKAGYKVHVEIVTNRGITSFSDKARTFLTTASNDQSGAEVRALIARHSAGIVHIHNFFPIWSPSAHIEAHAAGAAVVQTLHNYRLLCAGAQLLRSGAVCEKCVGGSPIWGVAHRCYKGSLLGSAGLLRMQRATLANDHWLGSVDQFIALTEFAKSLFVRGGIPASRISVKPNFKDAPAIGAREPGTGAIYVGRLSPEKGVGVLLDAWRAFPDLPLTIVGDGPGRADLEKLTPPNVRFLGHVDPARIAGLMAKASFIIVPSLWYEGFPMTVVEAFAAGLPVVASRIGSLEEVITDGIDGLLFTHGDPRDLERQIRQLTYSPSRLASMQEAALRRFRDHYTAEANLTALETIYERALANAGSSLHRAGAR